MAKIIKTLLINAVIKKAKELKSFIDQEIANIAETAPVTIHLTHDEKAIYINIDYKELPVSETDETVKVVPFDASDENARFGIAVRKRVVSAIDAIAEKVDNVGLFGLKTIDFYHDTCYTGHRFWEEFRDEILNSKAKIYALSRDVNAGGRKEPKKNDVRQPE